MNIARYKICLIAFVFVSFFLSFSFDKISVAGHEVSIINGSGNLWRVIGTPECPSRPYIEILEDGSLAIGLDTTSIQAQHANLLVKDLSTESIKTMSINSGMTGIYKHNGRNIKIKIIAISECEVEYEVE